MALYNIYFSAKGTTKLCADYIADCLSLKTESYNWLSQPCREPMDFSREDVLLFSMPVYSGFIPKTCAQMAKFLRGNQTPAIIAAVYGNRHYDNALLQMKDILDKQGFFVIAAGAFLAEHSVFPSVAHGRPDEQDKKAMADFAQSCTQLLQSDWYELTEVTVPGLAEYNSESVEPLPFKPFGDEKCVRCGKCVEVCPQNAISIETPQDTNQDLCINCGACIKVCPTGARNYHSKAYETVRQEFENLCAEYRKPEMYYAEKQF